MVDRIAEHIGRLRGYPKAMDRHRIVAFLMGFAIFIACAVGVGVTCLLITVHPVLGIGFGILFAAGMTGLGCAMVV